MSIFCFNWSVCDFDTKRFILNNLSSLVPTFRKSSQPYSSLFKTSNFRLSKISIPRQVFEFHRMRIINKRMKINEVKAWMSEHRASVQYWRRYDAHYLTFVCGDYFHTSTAKIFDYFSLYFSIIDLSSRFLHKAVRCVARYWQAQLSVVKHVALSRSTIPSPDGWKSSHCRINVRKKTKDKG